MLEISRQASLCKIKLLDPGVIEAVLKNNESVCGTDKLGPIEADELIGTIREKLKERFGGKLGGPPSAA